jgi:hypothetical protein
LWRGSFSRGVPLFISTRKNDSIIHRHWLLEGDIGAE